MYTCQYEGFQIRQSNGVLIKEMTAFWMYPLIVVPLLCLSYRENLSPSRPYKLRLSAHMPIFATQQQTSRNTFKLKDLGLTFTEKVIIQILKHAIHFPKLLTPGNPSVRIHTCIHACKCTRTHVYVCKCTWTHVYAWVCAYMQYMHVYSQVLNKHVQSFYTCTYIWHQKWTTCRSTKETEERGETLVGRITVWLKIY